MGIREALEYVTQTSCAVGRTAVAARRSRQPIDRVAAATAGDRWKAQAANPRGYQVGNSVHASDPATATHQIITRFLDQILGAGLYLSHRIGSHLLRALHGVVGTILQFQAALHHLLTNLRAALGRQQCSYRATNNRT